MSKKKTAIIASAIGGATLLAGTVLATVLVGAHGYNIVLEGDFDASKAIEYTGKSMQMPLAHLEDAAGNIVSYDVKYAVVNTKSGKKLENKYATFDLDTGDYKLIYSTDEGMGKKKEIAFSISDTTAPVITFTNVPKGVFLQDITADDIQKLPLYSIEDSSSEDGIDLTKKLYFKGKNDTDFSEVGYRDMNNSYTVTEFGTFKYEITASDKYGNSTTESTEWLIKDRTWKPDVLPADGILADYSTDGYLNYFESGDANQYYKIGTDYDDSWLAEYEGAEGVLKADLSFNNAAGYGNNCVRLYFAKNLTREALQGKYLAVRLRVEGKNIKDSFLFAGCNVAYRSEDETTRAFSTSVTDLVTDTWTTYYIDADLAEDIGIFPNATYNSETTVYDGGDAATYLQLCFARVAGYMNDMTLYVDSVSVAEKLPDTALTVSGNTASWTAVPGAAGYSVNINGETQTLTETSVSLPGEKGYIKVTPLGDGVLTLNAEEVGAVYGVDPGQYLAAFDDPIYTEMFTDKLNFSTSQENIGYRPKKLTASYSADGVQLDVATGYWGVCTGFRMILPKATEKGDNTSIILNMNVSNDDYGQIRVYDYDGVYISTIKLDESNTGKMYEFKVDLSSYNGKLKGLQLIFGPSKGMKSVADGVSILFKNIALKNTYYSMDVAGTAMTCVGERELVTGYSAKNLVQFQNFYDFGVAEDNTPLSFIGTVKLGGKTLETSDFNVIGYPNSATICFNINHNGKILTIMKGSMIYYNGKVALVEKTFNAYWDGSEWVEVADIPAEPPVEYITVNGEQKTVADRLALEPGYTTPHLVQFMNVCSFGVAEDNTPLGFAGTVKLDGKTLDSGDFTVVGYPNSKTVCLNVNHNGKILTVLKDSVIYYGEKAVVVAESFNARWNGTAWETVAEIPPEPQIEYITVGGQQRIKADTKDLTAGFTTADVTQFTNFYDFGVAADNTPIGFSGTVKLNGKTVAEPVFIAYAGSNTVCLNLSHKSGVILTVLKDSVIYYGEKAVVVGNTFNARWNGTSWEAVAEIPPEPQTEYITVGGEQREKVDTVDLVPGFTNQNVTQFINFYDFDVAADNTPIGFSGTVKLNGKTISNPAFIAYAGSSTICLNLDHEADGILTVLKDSVIYYGNRAVVVGNTFNARWDGGDYTTAWTAEADIPPEPEKEYITVGGSQREKVGEVQLTGGYTTGTLVQFDGVYDFGVAVTDTPLSFSGSVLLNGELLDGDKYEIVGYPSTKTVCLKLKDGYRLVGNILTIMKDSVIYYGDEAVVVAKSFNARWNGSYWEAVAELPMHITGIKESNNKLITLETDLPATTPLKDFTISENGCAVTESGFKKVGTIKMSLESGKIYLAFNFGSAFFKNKTYVLEKGSVFKFTDESTYQLSATYTFTFNGSTFQMS